MKKIVLMSMLLAMGLSSVNASAEDAKKDVTANKAAPKTASITAAKEAVVNNAISPHMRGLDSDVKMTIIDGSSIGSSLMGAKKNF